MAWVSVGCFSAHAESEKNSDNKSNAAHAHAKELAARLKEKFPQSDYTARAATLVFKLDEGVPVYGIDRE